jgi:hypothetical protein
VLKKAPSSTKTTRRQTRGHFFEGPRHTLRAEMLIERLQAEFTALTSDDKEGE